MWRHFCNLRWRRPLPHLALTSTAPVMETNAASSSQQPGAAEHGLKAAPAAQPDRTDAEADEQPNGKRKRLRSSSSDAAGAVADEGSQHSAAASTARVHLPVAPPTARQRSGNNPVCDERPAKLQRTAPHADAGAAAHDATSADAVTAASAAAVSAGSSGGSLAADGPAAAAPGGSNWRRLYASGNGWAEPRFQQWRFPPHLPATPLRLMTNTRPSDMLCQQAAPLQLSTTEASTLNSCVPFTGPVRFCGFAGGGVCSGGRLASGHRGCGAAGLLGSS